MFDKNDYYNSAKELAMKFIDNFKQFSADVPRNVLEAGPRLK
jgi:ATP-dependent phosphoenolpyruvate carboxykinase